LEQFEIAKETISSIRALRKDKGIPAKEPVELLIKSAESEYINEMLPVIKRLGNISAVRFVDSKPEGSASFLVKTTEFFIPVAMKIDTESEIRKLTADLDYYRGFLESVMKKLENERFVSNAPDSVIEIERKKKSDTESKINSLEEALKALKK
jgi:valyl-tRNA synthetase